MLTTLLPHYTYRRHCVRALVNLARGKGGLGPFLDSENWRLYQQYAPLRFRCNVCAEEGHPFFDFPDLALRRAHRIGVLRETLVCRHCGATMRHRTLAAALLERAGTASGRALHSIRAAAEAGLGGLQVLDTDSFSPIARILRKLPHYVVSSFHPHLPFDTQIEPGHYNVNLECMGFENGRFDIVMTSDVMEHVRHDEAAHAEIARVLRPAGHYVFTVPYDDSCADEHQLVDTSGPKDRHLVEPQYHGDPISGGILAYRVYGRSIYPALRRLGLDVEYRTVNDRAALIIDGDVFVATRT
jgi:O-antigen biosynthesis protein